MNKYVVAFWSDHTGELLQEEIEATSAVEAAIESLSVRQNLLDKLAESA